MAEEEEQASPAPASSPLFLREKHVSFALHIDDDKETFEYCATEHLRMQGVFWALGALDILGESRTDVDKVVDFVLKCYCPKTGGFSGNLGHDPHMLYTQHAVYVLAQCGALEKVDRDRVAAYIASMQQSDGSFSGDKWGEVDTRFSYCALASLRVLDRIEAINMDSAMRYIMSCQNFDGGFGSNPGAESHAGYVFTSVAALSIGESLDLLTNEKREALSWWLCERQCDSGGLNGRPEKQADVCYSWWVLSSLSILGAVDWIDKSKLVRFILECQDEVSGGIADRPSNMGDIYHTFFGLCGLSLLGYFDGKEGCANHNAVDPVYALPLRTVVSMGLPKQLVKTTE